MTDTTHVHDSAAVPNDDELDWQKSDGLLPAIIQHWRDGRVLMLGYMNPEALKQTRASGQVTFYSRSKQRLWTKGETSGNTLQVKSIHIDCDRDTILVLADPAGPTCHTGTDTCFGDDAAPTLSILGQLDTTIAQRHRDRPAGSYTTKLFDGELRRIAQKVGEEGVETALAAVTQDDDALAGEAADLIYHLIVLLRARRLNLDDIAHTVRLRNR